MIKLVILGLLMEGEKHPYEIQQIVNERGMNHYIKMAKGSLYYAFEQLEKKECIEVIDIVRDTNRPDKTIYRITEKGEEAFQDLLLKQFRDPNHISKPIYAGLAFATAGNQQKLAAILHDKIQETSHLLELMQMIYKKKIGTIPRSQLHILAGVMEHAQTEINWLTRLRSDALNERLAEIGTEIENIQINSRLP
ncbi:PadR family transcriptional regulator [Bacillus sp. 165]|uniref:PadR family transcriptional regulator n=1 Tax=Bacillus sp. 165 TaxID=1529117 RepID=UPI001ADC43F8|nr:PadR family transcriptional regulator [Bacillus sp. 165]MBO9130372.1 PadR family transcriptional regulator [Bacillus sp. 165]